MTRTTAVKALNELEREGYVIRKRGKVNIVAPRKEEVRGKMIYLLMQTFLLLLDMLDKMGII